LIARTYFESLYRINAGNIDAVNICPYTHTEDSAWCCQGVDLLTRWLTSQLMNLERIKAKS